MSGAGRDESGSAAGATRDERAGGGEAGRWDVVRGEAAGILLQPLLGDDDLMRYQRAARKISQHWQQGELPERDLLGDGLILLDGPAASTSTERTSDVLAWLDGVIAFIRGGETLVRKEMALES